MFNKIQSTVKPIFYNPEINDEYYKSHITEISHKKTEIFIKFLKEHNIYNYYIKNYICVDNIDDNILFDKIMNLYITNDVFHINISNYFNEDNFNSNNYFLALQLQDDSKFTKHNIFVCNLSIKLYVSWFIKTQDIKLSNKLLKDLDRYTVRTNKNYILDEKDKLNLINNEMLDKYFENNIFKSIEICTVSGLSNTNNFYKRILNIVEEYEMIIFQNKLQMEQYFFNIIYQIKIDKLKYI